MNQLEDLLYRKRHYASSELIDPLLDDGKSITETEPISGFRLSSKAFKAANNCQAQTWHVVNKTKALDPSAFAKSYFNDGNAWEACLLEKENRGGWIGRFNEVFGESLPKDTPFYDLASSSKGAKKDETWRTEVKKALRTVADSFDGNPTRPFILAQVSLIPAASLKAGNIDQSGIADLVIWSGAEWYIGEIKLSESATIEHGAQIRLYRELWPTLLESHNLCNTMASHGFVLHATPGFPFSTNLPEGRQQEATDVVALDTFTFEHLEDVYHGLIDKIKARKSEEACPEPFFQKRCAECGFRNDCYQKLLTAEDLSISFLPVPRSRSQALYESGITTLDAFIHSAESDNPHPVVQEISGNIPSVLEDLVAKARSASVKAGFSNWQYPVNWQDGVVFFGTVPGHGTGSWKYPDGSDVADFPDNAIIIAYTEVERRQAVATALQNGHNFRLSFSLQEEVQQDLHFPLPGWTLKEISAWAERMEEEEHDARFMTDWDYADLGNDLDDPGKRVMALISVWNLLQTLKENHHHAA